MPSATSFLRSTLRFASSITLPAQDNIVFNYTVHTSAVQHVSRKDFEKILHYLLYTHSHAPGGKQYSCVLSKCTFRFAKREQNYANAFFA
jgi:hypothetical protein